MLSHPPVNLAARFCARQLRPATSALHLHATPVRAAFSTLISPSTAPAQEPHSPRPLPPARWVSDVRARIGKCIIFGCDAAQIQRAAKIIGTLAREWRVLSAGSEGFLSGGLRGLEDQQVVWGEMDSFVGPSFLLRPVAAEVLSGYSPVRWMKGLGFRYSPRLISSHSSRGIHMVLAGL